MPASSSKQPNQILPHTSSLIPCPTSSKRRAEDADDDKENSPEFTARDVAATAELQEHINDSRKRLKAIKKELTEQELGRHKLRHKRSLHEFFVSTPGREEKKESWRDDPQVRMLREEKKSLELRLRCVERRIEMVLRAPCCLFGGLGCCFAPAQSGWTATTSGPIADIRTAISALQQVWHTHIGTMAQQVSVLEVGGSQLMEPVNFTSNPGTNQSVVLMEAYSLGKGRSVPDSSSSFPYRQVTFNPALLPWYSDPALDPVAEAYGQRVRNIWWANSDLNTNVSYINFAHGDEDLGSVYGENVGRLQQLKKQHDPNNVFNQWFALTPRVQKSIQTARKA